jgi:hypothetical protein
MWHNSQSAFSLESPPKHLRGRGRPERLDLCAFEYPNELVELAGHTDPPALTDYWMLGIRYTPGGEETSSKKTIALSPTVSSSVLP